MKDFADVLEREVLDGQIRVKRAPAGGYPDFVYQPRKSKEIIRLARASSMVTELAPIVVVFLRGVIARGDMLIIDEPEAHLHPWDAGRVYALSCVCRAGRCPNHYDHA